MQGGLIMSAVDKLYSINNKTQQKSVNIDDSLYVKIINLTKTKYDATVSELINICIEEYIEKNIITYYAKPKNESVTYRSIMIREKNFNWLKKANKQTGISVTRLINAAIKQFIDNNKEK